MKQQFKIFIFILFFAGAFAPFHFTRALLVFPDGSLIRGSNTPEVYFMENGIRRWVINEAAFRNLDFEWGKVKVVLDEELGNYPAGKILDAKSKYPEGVLLRADSARGGDGVKVYIIQKGAARWVADARDFENLGLDWQSVMDILPAKLKIISKGQPLTQSERVARPRAVLKDVPDKIIEDISAVFRFTGVAGSEEERNLKFETFMEGVDSNWTTVGSQERKVTLPQKSGQYKFFVRAKSPNGAVDPLPKVYVFEVRLSPYYGQVTISSSGLTSTDANKERLTLASKSAEPIELAGWTVGSEKYYTSFALSDSAYEIPDQPYYQYQKNLAIDSKRKITVFSGASPLGVNFRLNKCIGYLNSYHKFDPPIPSVCPKPKPDEIKNLNAYCQKAINSSAGSCKEPNLNDVLIDADCRDYMKEHLSYSKCVENNNQYYDFLTDEWRVYLRRSSEIWANEKDAILLRDKDGLLVNRLKY